MALNNKRISASELDFATIKANLKSYLSGQAQFTDYDFEGSTMSMLLDVLAYNTHYRGLYDNFMLNEMFLDSASKRANVVSKAKEIGYTPMSSEAPIAYVNFELHNAVNGPDTLLLSKYVPFSATLDGVSYTFITTETYTGTLSGGVYTVPNMKIIQGELVVNRFVVGSGTRFLLPEYAVDASTITVKIQTNANSSVYTTFNLTNEFVGLNASHKVFWIKEVDSRYELEFGNGVIGAALESGNIVHVEYIVSDGVSANGAKLFKYIGQSLYQGDVVATTVAQASGGTAIESIDSIKFNAPRLFTAQNRAVTAEDYRNLVYNLVPEAASVNVWSGADHTPPIYGKVFICIKPKTLEAFTTVEKIKIQDDIIKSKNVITIIPEIIDPEYIKIEIKTTVYFDPRSTTKTVNDIKQLALNTISNYNVQELQKFDSILRFSKLSKLIDDSDPSIVSNITTLNMRRRIVPLYNMSASYELNIVNPFHVEAAEPAVRTTGFYVYNSQLVHYIEDDSAGNLRLYNLVGNTKTIVNARIGTVNYLKGSISISGLNVTSIIGTDLDFIFKPDSYDVVSILNQLVTIPTALVTMNAIADMSFGASGGGSNYQFTSIRS